MKDTPFAVEAAIGTVLAAMDGDEVSEVLLSWYRNLRPSCGGSPKIATEVAEGFAPLAGIERDAIAEFLRALAPPPSEE